MAEYKVVVTYEYGDSSSVKVDFDLTPGEFQLPDQTKASLALAVAQAIADQLETIVVNSAGATLGTSTGTRYYSATEALPLA